MYLELMYEEEVVAGKSHFVVFHRMNVFLTDNPHSQLIEEPLRILLLPLL